MNALTSAFQTEGYFYDYHFEDGLDVQSMPNIKKKLKELYEQSKIAFKNIFILVEKIYG